MKTILTYLYLPILSFAQTENISLRIFERGDKPEILAAWYEYVQEEAEIEEDKKALERHDDNFMYGPNNTSNGKREGNWCWNLGGDDWVEGRYRDGIREGSWSWFWAKDYNSRKIMKEGNYKNGKRDGLWTGRTPEYITERGKVINYVEGTYINGFPQGIWTEWSYKGGQKFSQGSFKDGKPVGSWKKWHYNGEKRSEIRYENGKPVDGVLTSWHNEQEKNKESEGNIKNGKPDGVWTWWEEPGRVLRKGSYKDGKRDGLWTEWYSDARTKKKIEGNYVNGLPEGRWVASDAVEVYDTLIGAMRGFTVSRKHFNVIHEGSYKRGKMEGHWIEWYENSYGEIPTQKFSEGEYRNGLPIGIWAGWHEDGKKKYIRKYNDSGELVHSKVWNVEGQTKGGAATERWLFRFFLRLILFVIPIVAVIALFVTKRWSVRVLSIIGILLSIAAWFIWILVEFMVGLFQ